MIWISFVSDVKFLYLSPGNKDNYKELVDNPSTDIFTFIYQGTEIEIPGIVDPLVDRIKRGKLTSLKYEFQFT